MLKRINQLKPNQKIVWTVFAGIFLLSAYFIISTYFSFLSEAERGTLSRLQAIANTVANELDGDAHEIISARYAKPGELTSNESDSIYYRLWQPLHHAQEVNELETELATLVLNEDLTMDYMLNSLDSPYIRDPYDNYDPLFREYYETGGVIHRYTDEFGTWLTALSPVKNSKGEVVAILEVDTQFDTFISEARKTLAGNLAISVVIFVLIGFIILRAVKQIALADEEAKRKIEEYSQMLSQRNKDILDSITYARRIQFAILAPREDVFAVFKNAFIMYRPKDIVSGDFYYFSKVENHAMIAAVDCTGHGVPGALMSMIGNDFLNHITHERKITEPGTVLDLLHQGITNVLKQDGRHGETQDGMDIALLSFDLKNPLSIQYAGAYRALCIVRDGELIQIKANKFPIGYAHLDRGNFTNHDVELRKGDMCYIFTDGFADQFGGEQGKKFMVRKFHNLLLEISSLPIGEQEQRLNEVFDTWRGENEQVDDVLVIGIRV